MCMEEDISSEVLRLFLQCVQSLSPANVHFIYIRMAPPIDLFKNAYVYVTL